jgi:ribosomal protein S18 acetylase RimI-like enzyme
MDIRRAVPSDNEPIWAVLEPVIRAGETYALDRDMTREAALAYWIGPDRETYVAHEDGHIVGTYYIRANQSGGGRHVCNCAYVTSADATGRGVARGMYEHSVGRAREIGYTAMQFNFVISSNERAVRLWESLGFATVGRLPSAFRSPSRGLVDVLVMFRAL